MIILIAESKTMTACNREVSPDMLAANMPAGESEADEFMHEVRRMDIDTIREAARLSESMAERLSKMAFTFVDKTRGAHAMEAFTGVVFKAIGYESLPPEARLMADRSVRIISSLYGWLRPGDIIKQYRLEYTSRLTEDDVTMAAYWRERVTARLLADIRENNDDEVLDLLPSDAAKCIDMEEIRRHARVCKVDFVSVEAGGTLRTPHAGLLKKMRGTLLRAILEAGISRIDDLETFEAPGLLSLGSAETPGCVTFAV